MPRVGDVVAGKYRIESMIGEGGMGAVFAATHVLTEKRVALKWMRPDLAGQHSAVQRFLREARAAGRINHPNVVDIYDIGEHDGTPFLVMEYLQGEPLNAALERGALDPRRVIEHLLPAMRGVAAAHAKGVVHRDLKPDNIFLCHDSAGRVREPKVLDFGISKVSSPDGTLNPRLTRTGAVMGTPYYMSPEQLRDAAEIDQRTDVYAFGVILYEALTGRVPFDAENYSALILEIATGTPKRPRELRSDLPDGLERVVLKAMAREPDDRYQDVEALMRALEPFARGGSLRGVSSDSGARQRQSMSATTPFVSETPVHVPVRRTSLGIAVASLVALVAAGAVWALRGSSSSDAPAQANAPEPSFGAAVTAAASATPPAARGAQPAARTGTGSEGVVTAAKDAGVAHVESATTAAVPVAPANPAARGEEPERGRVRQEREARHPSHARDRVEPPPALPRPRGRTGGLKADEF